MKYAKHKKYLDVLTWIFLIGALPVLGILLFIGNLNLLVCSMNLWIIGLALVCLGIKYIDILEAIPGFKELYHKKNYAGIVLMSLVCAAQLFIISLLILGCTISFVNYMP